MAVRKVVLDLLEKVQHDIRLLDQIFSVFREVYAAACPLDKLAAPLVFDRLQTLGQGGLGHEEGVSGLCDAALFI